jgi:hypothetical protein
VRTGNDDGFTSAGDEGRGSAQLPFAGPQTPSFETILG